MINEMEIISNLRKQYGMSLREMSDASGVSFSAICNIEHGRHHTSLYVFQHLLDAFDLELAVVKKGSVE